MVMCSESGSDNGVSPSKELMNTSKNKGNHWCRDQTEIYIEDDDFHKDAMSENLNGNTLMTLSSITPGSKPTNVNRVRNKYPVKMPRRGIRKRVVFKNGDCNVSQEKVPKRRRRYMADIFTTLVDIQWRYNLMVFSLGFILSWLGFATVWWLICFTHGDFEHVDDDQWTPCVQNVRSFASAFLFSTETQSTIGYGYQYVTPECPEAVFLLCIQSIAGVMIQAFMVGVVFAKLSRPKKRTQTLLFSRNAVVSMRDGKLCLMFRIADMRKSHIIVAQVHAQLIKKRVTVEGEVLTHHLYDVKVVVDTCDDHLFFIWPCTLVHIIDEKSPFYNMSARDLPRENFEIVVILEGVIESTGMTTQARSSYLPSEIFWSHRFDPLVSYRKETGEYEVDYSRFNNTYEVETPLCSARELDELQKTGLPLRKHHTLQKRSNNRMPRSNSFESLLKNDGIADAKRKKTAYPNHN